MKNSRQSMIICKIEFISEVYGNQAITTLPPRKAHCKPVCNKLRFSAFVCCITHKSGRHASTSTCCKSTNNRELTILSPKKFLEIHV